MTKFKDTAAFEDLQTKVCLEIAGVILGRLKEVGVPDDSLQQVSDDLCYDLLAAMHDIGEYKVPGEEIYAGVLKAKLKEMAALKSKVKEMTVLEAKLKEMTVLEARLKEMAVLEAKLEEMTLLEAKLEEMAILEERVKEMAALEARLDSIEQEKEAVKDQPLPYANGVLSPDKVLSIVNSARVASA